MTKRSTLAAANPELAAQWHLDLNAGLAPTVVTAGSNRKVWWRCGRGHEWQATIANRSRGDGCPFCSGRRVIPGETDLATVNPELAAQWHPGLNGDLTPAMASAGSKSKAWWLCSAGHEWQASITSRSRGTSCPTCPRPWKFRGKTDLAQAHPELAAQWHPGLNGDLTPQEVSEFSNRKAWWRCEHGHDWQASIASRSKGTGCPLCSGLRAIAGETDLATARPDLAAQWHPTKNGDLTPAMVSRGSGRMVWWRCDHGDQWQARINGRSRQDGAPCPGHRRPRVDRVDKPRVSDDAVLAAQWHPNRNGDLTPDQFTPGSRRRVWWQCEQGHEWEVSIHDHGRGTGCPQCVRAKGRTGARDLATVNPALAEQWHPSRNGDLTPSDVTSRSDRVAWWLGACGHEWEDSIYNRARGRSCPRLECRPLRSLATVVPNLAAQWHPSKNGDLTPAMVSYGTRRKVWWLCESGHDWEAVVGDRVQGAGCPMCSRHGVVVGVNDLPTTHPSIAAQWDRRKNRGWPVTTVKAGSGKAAWWRCPEGHQWRRVVRWQVKAGTCPTCIGRPQRPKRNDLAAKCPDLAAQWHPTRNGDLTPEMVAKSSRVKAWWTCSAGHEWRAAVYARSRGDGCPTCAGLVVAPGENDLATLLPELAAQWHPTKNGDLTPSLFKAHSRSTVWWACGSGHHWQARICDRSRGKGCPFCSGRRRVPGVNDLATVRADLAVQWHPSRNGDLHPAMVGPGSIKKVWWLCSAGHAWEARVGNRVRGTGCPQCHRLGRRS